MPRDDISKFETIGEAGKGTNSNRISMFDNKGIFFFFLTEHFMLVG